MMMMTAFWWQGKGRTVSMKWSWYLKPFLTCNNSGDIICIAPVRWFGSWNSNGVTAQHQWSNAKILIHSCNLHVNVKFWLAMPPEWNGMYFTWIELCEYLFLSWFSFSEELVFIIIRSNTNEIANHMIQKGLNINILPGICFSRYCDLVPD